jgi:hypothetical protein
LRFVIMFLDISWLLVDFFAINMEFSCLGGIFLVPTLRSFTEGGTQK